MKNQNILIGLGHPAHYHLFKHMCRILREKGHQVHYVVTPKEMLEELLTGDGESYTVLAPREKGGLIQKMNKIRKSTAKLIRIAREQKTDLMIGCIPQVVFAGKRLRIPSILMTEDHFAVMWLLGTFTFPFTGTILTPETNSTGPFKRNRVSYAGFQKLAYMHPNYFIPDRSKVNVPEHTPFYILRTASLSAYHDMSAKAGLNNELVRKLVDLLAAKGKVYISSERPLPEDLEQYKFTGEKKDMHHYLAFTDLFIGDSSSMATESAMLGTPNIRFSDYVGRPDVGAEIEEKYHVSIGLRPSDAGLLLQEADRISGDPSCRSLFAQRRDHMLSEKIDVTGFLVWFTGNYPESKKIMQQDPSYQFKFR